MEEKILENKVKQAIKIIKIHEKIEKADCGFIYLKKEEILHTTTVRMLSDAGIDYYVCIIDEKLVVRIWGTKIQNDDQRKLQKIKDIINS
ncbi:MAG: hypothetical protein ACFFDN_02740 [Candidatus Hodarchaeota archaeon]